MFQESREKLNHEEEKKMVNIKKAQMEFLEIKKKMFKMKKFHCMG